MCGVRPDHVDHVDRIHPVLFGGTDDPANLQALCVACNLAKGALERCWGQRRGVESRVGEPGSLVGVWRTMHFTAHLTHSERSGRRRNF